MNDRRTPGTLVKILYEKVVKVKADVAAIVNFSPDRAHRGRQSGAGTPVVLIGGIRVTAVFASEYGSEV